MSNLPSPQPPQPPQPLLLPRPQVSASWHLGRPQRVGVWRSHLRQGLIGLGLVGLLAACGQPPADSTPSGPDATASAPTLETDSAPAAVPNAVDDPGSSEVAAADWDTVIVPGERVGPVTAATTYADLVAIFGPEALQDGEIHLGEGFTTLGTVVDSGRDRHFTVIWADDSRQQVIEVREFGSAWTTPEGIGPGSSLTDLQRVLGPFEFSGFGWDYGGTVLLTDTALAAYDGLLFLRLQPDNWDAPELAEFIGDRPFAADNPALAALNLTVDTVVVRLEN